MMSTLLAQQEMRRFLGNEDAEVLSISGRWGVGKTYGWRAALTAARAAGKLPRDRYAYVSAFGVRSIDALKAAIFQSTVRLDAPTLEPTLQSFQELLSSSAGIKTIAEQGGRKGVNVLKTSETVEKGLREIGVADGWRCRTPNDAPRIRPARLAGRAAEGCMPRRPW